MKFYNAIFALLFAVPGFADTDRSISDIDQSIVKKPSQSSVDQTVERLTDILQKKGVKIFAVIDHSGEAEKAGLKMPPTKLIIFGSPKAGTPLMLEAPEVALDLPLKILVWEDQNGKVWLSYNRPDYLLKRYHLSSNFQKTLDVVESLAEQASQ